MLLNNVLIKTIRDQIRPLKWWSLGISIYCSSITFLYVAMEDSIGEMAELYPAEVAKVFGIDNISDIASPSGWLNAEAYSLMLPICLIIFGVFAGANSIGAEEENRTIEILLSEPLSRTSLFFQKYAVFMLNMIIMSSIICLSIYIPNLIINMELGIYGIFSATLSVTLIAILMGTGSFSISAITGKRRLSLIIPVVVSLLSYMSNVADSLSDSFDVINRLSLFRYYDIPEAFETGVNFPVAAIFLAVTFVILSLGCLSFNRRDLRL
ncbi:MAG: hypothetical protein FI729_03760 [SAR202 cluster bacterium]|nr:hypothetical protein [SAR202 cluster bacterium]|tara:strand:- start:13440 stop:14240 length:801 start_codon:yes stop_codon:yes gene_type:complete